MLELHKQYAVEGFGNSMIRGRLIEALLELTSSMSLGNLEFACV